MKRVANTCVLVLAQCHECHKCLGFQLVTGDHSLQGYIGCFFWFLQMDNERIPFMADEQVQQPLFPAQMNATLNLSVNLHCEYEVDRHNVIQVKEDLEAELSKAHAMYKKIKPRREEIPAFPVSETPYTDMDGLFLCPN
jgi:hypothetical protein